MTVLANEDEAWAWSRRAFAHVPRETWTLLTTFEKLLRDENGRQNLVAATSLGMFALRHLADSAQLALLAPPNPLRWLDLGSGAGFPGLIIAALTDHRVTLVEARRLRIDFLARAAAVLGVEDRLTIAGMPLERFPTGRFDVISARAFAPLERLLPLACRFSTEKTRWILPKGRGAQSELERARATWQGTFRLEPSLTEAEARIIVAEGVRPRPKWRETS